VTVHDWVSLASSVAAIAVAIVAAFLARASALRAVEQYHNQHVQKLISDVRDDAQKAVEGMRASIQEQFVELRADMRKAVSDKYGLLESVVKTHWDDFTECRREHFMDSDKVYDRLLSMDKQLSAIATELKLRNGKGGTPS
jgi:uncharacterized protein YhaN